jgi:hypothetical protein
VSCYRCYTLDFNTVLLLLSVMVTLGDQGRHEATVRPPCRVHTVRIQNKGVLLEHGGKHRSNKADIVDIALVQGGGKGKADRTCVRHKHANTFV